MSKDTRKQIEDPMAEDELQKEIEELLTQLVVDIHSKTVQGGLLLADATIFKATDKILTLYNAYTTNKIIEAREGGLDKQSDTASVGGNQVDKSNSGAYHDGYRDGSATITHLFKKRLEIARNEIEEYVEYLVDVEGIEMSDYQQKKITEPLIFELTKIELDKYK